MFTVKRDTTLYIHIDRTCTYCSREAVYLQNKTQT